MDRTPARRHRPWRALAALAATCLAATAAAAEPSAAAEPVPPASDEEASAALSSLWELGRDRKRGTFVLRPHRATYFLPVRYTTRVNAFPASPSRGTVAAALPVKPAEVKFQLSTKIKAWEDLPLTGGDLWFAYTQQSHWQLYHHGFSSPFRETDYEPEVVLAWRVGARLLGWRWDLLDVAFVHQSNGQGGPLSRSWNRIYAQAGITRGRLAILVRPWARVPETSAMDDNPDVSDFMGRGDLRVSYLRGGSVVSVAGRYAGRARGAVQVDWALAVKGGLKAYLQLTHGHGESLLDYNHRQSTAGVGLMLLE